ncbi:MAG: aldo/keto reductase, partial [Caldilinea sp.]|nr:aldo/keto reductase [Caldilinea sp.]
GVIPYSPLGGGLLTGKYGTSQRPAAGRLVENAMYQKRYGADLHYAVAERFTDYANARGIHPATLAVAWVMSHPAVTAPIIGARNLEQLEASLAAADVEMTPAWRAEISALSVEPPPATDRSEER